MKRMKVYANVWDAIEPDPAKRENLKLRSVLMSELTRHIRSRGLTQAQAAFSLDLLTRMAVNAGLRVTMQVKKAA
jgi:predicted XRE-type DNA-binding protein